MKVRALVRTWLSSRVWRRMAGFIGNPAETGSPGVQLDGGFRHFLRLARHGDDLVVRRDVGVGEADPGRFAGFDGEALAVAEQLLQDGDSWRQLPCAAQCQHYRWGSLGEFPAETGSAAGEQDEVRNTGRELGCVTRTDPEKWSPADGPFPPAGLAMVSNGD